jgi:uncharacterized membrane protein
MMEPHQHTRIDRWVRVVLVWGMVLSVAVLVIGLLLYVVSPTGHAEVDLSLQDIATELLELNPIAVIDLGIVMLIATPLTRVLTALVVFIVDRETRFVLVALLVLAVITIAILAQ